MNKIIAKEKGYYLKPSDILKGVKEGDWIINSDSAEVFQVDALFLNTWKVQSNIDDRFKGSFFKKATKEQIAFQDEIDRLRRRLGTLHKELKATI